MAHILHIVLLIHLLLCLRGNAFGSEIINGKKTSRRSKQYMASLQDNRGHHVCGGFLISEDFVLTAAHCDDVKPTSVVLGTHDLRRINNETMRYTVKKCKHPSYVTPSSGNDIMLLKLSRKAQVGKKAIEPIQLPRQEMKFKEKDKGCVAGWGFTRTRGEIVSDLHEVDVPILNLDKCQELWRNVLPANIICAGGYGTKKGFCQGDSGGPLVYKKLAVGVVSFNSNWTCDYPDFPNIYTDISSFLPWIKNILKKKRC